jgi:hypothetical protein
MRVIVHCDESGDCSKRDKQPTLRDAFSVGIARSASSQRQQRPRRSEIERSQTRTRHEQEDDGHSKEASIDPVHPAAAGKAPAQPTFHGGQGGPPKAAPAAPKNPVASKLNVKGDTK